MVRDGGGALSGAGEDDIPWEGPSDEDFEALGFDTAFGASPGAPGGGLGDNDDTPPGGIYVGEDVQILDAATIGRALAEVEGRSLAPDLPDLDRLQSGLIGIDVGASVAVVARFDANGRHEIVPNEHDERLTPVQIFFDDDGEKLVGSEARQMAPSAPHRAVINLKQALADPNFTFEPDSEHELNAEEIVGLFLKQLVANARETGEISHMALAAPAWFSDRERQALARAAEGLEGMELVGITDECLASAATYSLRLPDLRPRTALVFDLGHAALGVGIVRCASGDIEVLAQKANRDLGSSAWDALLYNEAARKFEEVHGVDPRSDPAAEMDLWQRAEGAKKALSQRPQCTLVASAGGKSLKIGFTRRGFENAAKGLLDASLELLREVRKASGLASWEAVDALLMTGGGCKTPSIRRAVAREVGRTAERGTGMEEGVAVGTLYWGIAERYRKSRT